MRLPRSGGISSFVAALAAIGVVLAVAPPPPAQARSLPCVGIPPAGVVGDAIGIGNPVADACEALTDPVLGPAGKKILGPLKEAAGAIGEGVFDQVTSWVAEGAVWLIGEIAGRIDETTAPNLLGKGFLHQYRLMAQIGALLAALMLIFVVLEALAHGDAGLLWRAFLVHVPLAALATSCAYLIVQLLLATSDGLGEALAQGTSGDARSFFKRTIEGLVAVGAEPQAATGASLAGAAGTPTAGAATGAVAVPLFVGFTAAMLAAFAALFVWIELLMRDAAIYVVSLFMPLALAASIWPRWGSALRRTCELVIVVVFSKFVIVAIISLAASLVARGEASVEQVLAASAMLMLACFSPLVLFRLVPFAEASIGAAYERRGAGGGAARAREAASSVQMMRRAAVANWAPGGPGTGGGRGRGGGGSLRGGGPGGLPASGRATAGSTGAPPGVAASLAAGGARVGRAAAEKSAAGTEPGTAGGSGGGGRVPSPPAGAAGESRSAAAGHSHRAGARKDAGQKGADPTEAPPSGARAGAAPARRPDIATGATEATGAGGGPAPRGGGKPPRPSGGEGAGPKAGGA